MKLAYCSHAITKDNIDESIEFLQNNDITIMESGYPLFKDLDEESSTEVCKRFREHGIEIQTLHAPFGKDDNISSLKKDERAQAVKNHKEALMKARAGKIKKLIIHPGVGGVKEEEREEMASALLMSLEELTAFAERMKVKLALENMLPQHLGDDPDELLYFVESLDSPWLGICFDTGHAHVAGDMREAFEKFKDLIITFHVQDNDGTRDLHLQPGYGTTNWQDFIEVFDTMNFTEPVVIEAQPWGGIEPSWMFNELYALFENNRLRVKELCPEVDDAAGELITLCPKCGYQPIKVANDWICRCKVRSKEI